jgi:hypothetical protein
MNVLEGKKVVSVEIASDQKALRFFIDDGSDIVARADGDCCSSTWIEHVELPVNGFPATVVSVSDVEMPDLGTPDGFECVAYYGCKIETDKGTLLIDYRNESNGYYGGNLSWPGEYFYGGVYGQNESSKEWKPVKSDI